GFLSMGEDICNDMYNWHIPSTMGPSSLIAPFWDDFDPTSSDSSGDVFYLYEEDNNRFIVEWSRVQHIHNYLHETPSELQTFEVLLLDPDYHLTPTDDGEIVFQYHTTQNDDSIHNFATVGIGDHNHRCGLEYTFANSYPPEASTIINGRAIKFTTQPPDTFLGVNEEYDIIPDIMVYPNPSFSNVSIKLIGGDIDLTDSKLCIYDLMGRCICNLKTESLNKQFLWDIRDESDLRLPKGIYFIKLTGSNFDITRKFVLLK
ncbi:T9SS type A sorting domain-containing protein, partial [candidate division WOR-3 bacterium]|nr:T9SS type A sorting domain-containing protein [candidate division WOR-3 bacterium]